MHSKSSRFSVAYREKGNESYTQRKLYEALVYYNKALAFAETNEELGFAYSDRSLVYLEIKKYEKCLQNIDWARETNEFTEDECEKLKEREEKCKIMMQTDTKEVPESFFKLSYPANPKIPFIVENLYMKKTPKYGRGIYAATDLKAGDVIAIEKPVVSVLKDSDDSRYKHCCFCMKSSTLNLIPCLKTSIVMYCSEDCRNEVDQSYFVKSPQKMIIAAKNDVLSSSILMALFSHFFKEQNEFVKFVTLYNDKKNFNQTVFDFDFSNPADYKMNMLHCFLALNHKKEETRLNRKTQKLLSHFEDVLRINRISMVYQEPNSSIEREHGYGVLMFGSLFNHSCDYNVHVVVVDNKFAFVVQKPIKADEQLFMTYGESFFHNMDVTNRRRYLSTFDFICECEACVNNDAYIEKIESSKFQSPLNRSEPKTYEEAVKELKKNWAYIEDHADNKITHKNYMLMSRNFDLLYILSKFEAYPQMV